MKNLLIITIALLALVVILVALLIFKVTRLSKQVSLLSQPIIHIDVEAANVIAEQLASMTLVETNKYDAISAQSIFRWFYADHMSHRSYSWSLIQYDPLFAPEYPHSEY